MDGLDLRATTPFRSFGLRNRLQMTTPYRRAEVLESTPNSDTGSGPR